jgi:hypothetical protein
MKMQLLCLIGLPSAFVMGYLMGKDQPKADRGEVIVGEKPLIDDGNSLVWFRNNFRGGDGGLTIGPSMEYDSTDLRSFGDAGLTKEKIKRDVPYSKIEDLRDGDYVVDDYGVVRQIDRVSKSGMVVYKRHKVLLRELAQENPSGVTISGALNFDGDVTFESTEDALRVRFNGKGEQQQ